MASDVQPAPGEQRPPALLPAFMSAITALGVGMALGQMQFAREFAVDDSPVSAQFSHTVKFGWPAFWLSRHEYGNSFVPRSKQIDYSLLSYGNLAVNLAAWLAMVAASAYVVWRMFSHRWQFSMRVLLVSTAAVALLLGWWRLEYQACWMPTRPRLTGLLVELAETPMLRLLRFRPDIYLPVLFAEACAIVCVPFAGQAIWRRMRTGDPVEASMPRTENGL